MPIRIACSNCNEPLRVPDYAAGQPVQCPHCDALSEVPDVKPTRRRRRRPDGQNSPVIARPRKEQPLGTVSLVLGMLAVVTSCVPGLSAVFAIMAVVLGAVGMTRESERSAARAGVTLGILAFVLMIVIVFAFAGLVMKYFPEN